MLPLGQTSTESSVKQREGRVELTGVRDDSVWTLSITGRWDFRVRVSVGGRT